MNVVLATASAFFCLRADDGGEDFLLCDCTREYDGEAAAIEGPTNRIYLKRSVDM